MAKDETNMIKSLTSVQLPMEPACLEFCPAHPEYLVVGSWHLIKDDEDTQAREGDDAEAAAEAAAATETHGQGGAVGERQRHMGRIDVYRIQGEEVNLVHTEEQPHSAIWDLQFQTHDGFTDILAAGSSAGTVFIYRLSPYPESPKTPLLKLSVIGPISKDEEVMVTKCCWHPTIPNLLAISTLAGEVHLISLDGDDFSLLTMAKVSALAHTEPAWTVAMSPQVAAGDGTDDRVFTVYSGGDDMAFRYATVSLHPQGGHGAPAAAAADMFDDALFQPAKKSWHMAGVVSILPLPITLPSDGSQIVVTGSYDDNVRVCAVRPLHETYGVAAARVLGELHVGGGAWRLRLIELAAGPGGGSSWRLRLLAPCMSLGSRVIEICGADDKAEWTITVLGSWCEEVAGAGMLNYGSDVQPRRSDAEDEKLTCVSTNFYGKMLYLWRF